MLVVMALGNAALPRLARCYNDADWIRFRNTLLLFLAIGVGLGVATLVPVLLAGDWLITRVFGAEYGGQNTTFVWLAAGAAITYCSSVFGYAATASRRINFQPIAFGVVAAVTAIGCYWTVPALGGLGAAIAVSVAATVGLLFYVASFAGTARDLRARAQERRVLSAAAGA
jgi:O-antigen/teichoic acid export membrane protein